MVEGNEVASEVGLGIGVQNTATTTTPSKALTRSRGHFGPCVDPDLAGCLCKSMRNLVGASGFEPPASWSRTKKYQQLTSIVY